MQTKLTSYPILQECERQATPLKMWVYLHFTQWWNKWLCLVSMEWLHNTGICLCSNRHIIKILLLKEKKSLFYFCLQSRKEWGKWNVANESILSELPEMHISILWNLYIWTDEHMLCFLATEREDTKQFFCNLVWEVERTAVRIVVYEHLKILRHSKGLTWSLHPVHTKKKKKLLKCSFCLLNFIYPRERILSVAVKHCKIQTPEKGFGMFRGH